MREKPLVAVIIVNWNGLDDTRMCLYSFKKITYPMFHIIVVDNGSTMNEAVILYKEYKKHFPRFDCIRVRKNYGFIGGCNIGIVYARKKINPDYYLIMNNDIVVDPNFLSELINVMESDRSIGLASPKVLWYPDNGRIWWNNCKINWWTGQIFTGFNLPNKKERYTSKKYYEVDGVTGACMIIRSEVIEQVGLPDPAYFLSGVDTYDYSLRAKKKGFKAVCVPSAIVYHKFSQAAQKIHFLPRMIEDVVGHVRFFCRFAKLYQLPILLSGYLLSFIKDKFFSFLRYLKIQFQLYY